MVRFNQPVDDLQAHFDIADKAATAVSKTFRPPNELEVEKLYLPYILYSKKR